MDPPSPPKRSPPVSVPVSPLPPTVPSTLPFIGAGLPFLRNPTQFLIAARQQHGDTFLLEVFGFRLLFTFSAAGVRSLYKMPESTASFVEATRTLIGFKLPGELLTSDMKMFHHLFGRGQMETYLGHIHDAVAEELTQLGPMGEMEIFAKMKILVHRVGFRCWAGKLAASPRYFLRLVWLFEQMDPEQAFVRPGRTFITLMTRKSMERKALREVAKILADIWKARQQRPAEQAERDMLDALHELYEALPETERFAAVARDIMILHLASLSNLYAALSWTLIHLLEHPADLARVRDQADVALLERYAHESIRVAQRSITLRKIMTPCTFDDGATRYQLEPGVFLATMLSVNNSAFPGLESFDPDHYEKSRVCPRIQLPTPEVVSTFGHGSHACPGQRFALSAIRITLTELLNSLALTPLFEHPVPEPKQIGAVARAAQPCVVRFEKRRFRSDEAVAQTRTGIACPHASQASGPPGDAAR